MGKIKLNAIDLFSGCGGLSEGLKQAKFNVIAGVEIDSKAASAYKLNHKSTVLLEEDIKRLEPEVMCNLLQGRTLHLLAGCPPCQGFSTIRKLNKRSAVRDDRNALILEYSRMVEALRPLTLMLENVPGIENYNLFGKMVRKLRKIGYQIDFRVVNVADFSVPQRRRRLVLVGSRVGMLNVAEGPRKPVTVREALSVLANHDSSDELHQVRSRHSDRIRRMISLVPKDGGGRKDLPIEYRLKCHENKNIGFNDIYGRLKWDDVSSTITGGCLNPSKGRFLHPEEDRCISAREASLLQTFPMSYKFPTNIPKQDLALMIGNALPPTFCRIQAENIHAHLSQHI